MSKKLITLLKIFLNPSVVNSITKEGGNRYNKRTQKNTYESEKKCQLKKIYFPSMEAKINRIVEKCIVCKEQKI